MTTPQGIVTGSTVREAVLRVCDALESSHESILELDQLMGDGDLGITVAKIAAADRVFAQSAPLEDIGEFLTKLGMETNKAAPSTMGTLLATGLLRAGKEARGTASLTPDLLVKMLVAVEQGIQERGKAKLGDKTVLDALHPAVGAFIAGISSGKSAMDAGMMLLDGAEDGLASVTNIQSRIGRASWLGERTIGLVDPGCATLVVILKAILGQ